MSREKGARAVYSESWKALKTLANPIGYKIASLLYRNKDGVFATDIYPHLEPHPDARVFASVHLRDLSEAGLVVVGEYEIKVPATKIKRGQAEKRFKLTPMGRVYFEAFDNAVKKLTSSGHKDLEPGYKFQTTDGS